MRQPAEYFLLKTKRTHITESEAENLRELDKIHTAARVNREIDAAVEDFMRWDRTLQSLSLGYIFAKLCRQQSLPAPGAPGNPRQGSVPVPDDKISSQNVSNYQVDNVLEMFEDGAIETVEELREVCDMYHLTEEEKKRVFQSVGERGEVGELAVGAASERAARAGSGD
jgi:hypothetical protein